MFETIGANSPYPPDPTDPTITSNKQSPKIKSNAQRTFDGISIRIVRARLPGSIRIHMVYLDCADISFESVTASNSFHFSAVGSAESVAYR